MEDKKTELLLTKFNELSKKFRPRFGNQNDIDIARMCVKVGDALKVVEKRKDDVKQLKKAEVELGTALKQAVFLMERQHDTV